MQFELEKKRFSIIPRTELVFLATTSLLDWVQAISLKTLIIAAAVQFLPFHPRCPYPDDRSLHSMYGHPPSPSSEWDEDVRRSLYLSLWLGDVYDGSAAVITLDVLEFFATLHLFHHVRPVGTSPRPAPQRFEFLHFFLRRRLLHCKHRPPDVLLQNRLKRESRAHARFTHDTRTQL